jgi:hypothetical protein
MSGTGFDVVVHFSEPVPGIHPIDGGPFRADRHVFKAHHLWQDAADTRLMNADDVTVAQWPTDLVDRVVWKPIATGSAPQQARPAAAASNPGAATQTPADHTHAANVAANHAANQAANQASGAPAGAASGSHVGEMQGADAGDWIQPMTLKTSQDAVGAGSPRPTS